MLDHMLEFYQVFGLISLGISCPDHKDPHPLLSLKKKQQQEKTKGYMHFLFEKGSVSKSQYQRNNM